MQQGQRRREEKTDFSGSKKRGRMTDNQMRQQEQSERGQKERVEGDLSTLVVVG